MSDWEWIHIVVSFFKITEKYSRVAQKHVNKTSLNSLLWGFRKVPSLMCYPETITTPTVTAEEIIILFPVGFV